MTLDPALPTLVAVVLITLATSLVLKIFKQPHMVAYILVGALIGPHGFALMENTETASRIGTIGVVLLLFFVGLELSPTKIIKGWRVNILGTIVQILLSVLAVWLLGLALDWPLNRIVLIGFVISLTSTAVVLNIVQDRKLVPQKIADGSASITIMQDIALIPMLVIIGLMAGGGAQDGPPFAVRLIGAALMILVAVAAVRNKSVELPFRRLVVDDKELQMMTAFAICLGMALLSAFIGLSTALGAFVAGLVVASLKATDWAKSTTEPFRHILMAVFFVSVGMMLELEFVYQQWLAVLGVFVAAILTNLFVNALALRFSGFSWREALFAGTILSQIGEFSFVLAAIGLNSGLISGFAYQLTVSVIALSLLTSPVLIGIAGRWFHGKAG